ncbi:MAG: protein-disulfide reductase DsbD [Castellaniella sp.]
MKKLLVLWLFALSCLGISGASLAAEDFLDPELAFISTVAQPDPLTLDIHYQIAPHYYMYQERFEVQIEDAQGQLLLYRRSTLTPPEMETRRPIWPGTLQLPHGQVKYDPTFERNMEVYHQQVTLRAPLQAGASGPLTVTVTGQGCADAGLCYPPMTQTFQLLANAQGYAAQGTQVRSQVPAPQDEVSPAAQTGQSAAGGTQGTITSGVNTAASNQPASGGSVLDLGDTGMAAWLQHAPLWQILGLSFLLGILLSFTPCVLPMVPILLAIIAGSAPGTTSRARGLGLAAVYVLGMSLIYTALGIAAGLLGAGMAAWLQSPWVLGTFAVLLALFALAMLDVFTLQVPVGLQSRLQNWQQRLPGGQVGGVFLMGMLSALIVGPCIAAPLAGVLLFISQTGDMVVGGSALFAMAWGEGLLLLVVGFGAGALLPRAGAWMNPLKAGFGILLLATAWWMAQPLLPGVVLVVGWVVLAFWAAMLLWGVSASSDVEATNAPLRLLVRALALLIGLWGLAQGVGLLAGGQDMLRPLEPFTGRTAAMAGGTVPASPQAIRARFAPVNSVAQLDAILATTHQPVMLDFYADWCVSCLEMEKFTFSNQQVSSRMDQMLLLQADVTRMTPEDRALLARFNLFGPPGILFFDRRGMLLPEARVVGFKKAEAFLAVQDEVLASP